MSTQPLPTKSDPIYGRMVLYARPEDRREHLAALYGSAVERAKTAVDLLAQVEDDVFRIGTVAPATLDAIAAHLRNANA